MDLFRALLFVILVVGRLTFVFGGLGVARNLTDFVRHRDKRGLIFQNGGNAKIVVGPIFPIAFGDPVEWRSLLALYNLHIGEFKIPDTPLYPWDKWETLYARSQSHTQTLEPDSSREFVYTAFEYFMDRSDGSGRACLLRSMCENAQIDHHMDIFGEVLDVILTPGKEELDPVYREAHLVGKSGADCLQYYPNCPKGVNLLDQFIDEG